MRYTMGVDLGTKQKRVSMEINVSDGKIEVTAGDVTTQVKVEEMQEAAQIFSLAANLTEQYRKQQEVKKHATK